MKILTRVATLGAAVSFVVLVSACGATTTPAASSPSSTPAGTVTSASPTSASSGMMSSSSSGMMSSSSSMMSSAVTGTHNQADVTFAQSMIVHHQGAIEMADLAPTRAASSQVKDLAVTIKAAQGPEITRMTGWIAAWGSAGSSSMPNSTSADGGMGGMDMGGGTGTSMPGMMSGDETSQLTAASGAAFDKLFLQLMITHHEGALEMAQTEKGAGENPDALALAESIITSQTAQIASMKTLLQGM